MSSGRFRKLLEQGDSKGLKDALESNPALVNQGIEWFQNQKNESDPLHYVSDCAFNGWLDDNRAVEIAALLLEYGAMIEGTEGRESPLIAATSLAAEGVAKLLIESGADIEASAVFGARPLHWAASMGLPSTVELLIKKGVELEAKCTEFGSTPLYWAVFSFGSHGPNKKRDPLSAAKALLNAGANVDTKNNQGISAVELSRRADSTEMCELLSQYSQTDN